MGTETAIGFGLVMVGSLALLMDPPDPWVAAGIVLVLGALALVATAYEVGRSLSAPDTHDRAQVVIRLGVPILCFTAIAVGGLGLGLGHRVAPTAVALAMLLLLAAGMRNAWDLLLQSEGLGDDASPPD